MNIKQLKLNLKSIIGKKAYHYLRCGGYLKIWRCSSPHNWFIETTNGNILWHSHEGEPKPCIWEYFDKVKDSNKQIIQYWGSDSGMPELSIYKLKEIFL